MPHEEPMTKTGAGNFFEDFRLGQTIRHATPRTLTDGDVALYVGMFGSRFAGWPFTIMWSIFSTSPFWSLSRSRAV